MDKTKDEMVRVRVPAEMKRGLVSKAGKKHPHGCLSTYLREVFRGIIKR